LCPLYTIRHFFPNRSSLQNARALAVDHVQIMRALGRPIAFTRDLERKDAGALVPFRIVVAICEDDFQELHQLLADSVEALAEAADAAPY
jgi:hypothetical protein